jgi:hypothetical protein
VCFPSRHVCAPGAARRPLCGSGGVLVGPDATPVDHGKTPAEGIVVGGLRLPRGQHPIPDPGRVPAPKPAVDGLPGSVPLGQIPPGGAGAQEPEDAVEDRAVILGRPPRARALWGQQRGEPLPLLVRPVVSSLRAHLPKVPPLCRHTLVVRQG